MSVAGRLELTTGEVIEYTIRQSQRSRRLRLTLDARGLRVSAPLGWSRRRIEQAVHAQHVWLAQHWPRVAALGLERVVALPERIDLPACDEVWHIVRIAPAGQRTRLCVQPAAGGGMLALRADVSPVVAAQLLQRWLATRARDLLLPWVDALALQHGHQHAGVTIRQARTRWGSCSARNTLSLNWHLLFLPVDLVEYVLVHELCHTREHNHSPRFWAEVGRCLPDWAQRRRRLRQATAAIPPWVRWGVV